MSNQDGNALMCSIVSREEDERIIGSARDVKQFLFMELEKPWAESALDTDHLPEAANEAYVEGCKNGTFDGKFLPIAPDPEYSRAGYVRFLDYRRPDEAFATYEKEAYLVPDENLAEVTHILMAQPERRDELTPFREEDAPEQEIMVCTHMERDPCCGHFGPPIHRALRTHYADDNLRAWEVSHVGGHRYCPNLISLPDGRYWGRMELRDLDNFVNHSGAFSDLSDQYRGWAALSPPEQIVEQRAFEQEGWSWVNYNKTSSITERNGDDDGRYRVTISYHTDGTSGTYQGIVEESEPVRALKSECGSRTESPSYKTAVQYELTDLSHRT